MHRTPASATLSDAVLNDLIQFRRRLHQHPELSGNEGATASAVVDFLADSAPNEVITGLGGHGIALVYGAHPGPTLLLRAELDALPIAELTDLSYRSENDGVGHHCGHDGHMAILAGVGRVLGDRRPSRGRVVLLYQPSEENGAGAAAVLADPAFERIRPDIALALHTLSSQPMGRVVVDEGVVNCASRGLRIVLEGKTTHASAPENGVSPTAAVAALLDALPALGIGGALIADYRLVTVTHAVLGEEAFGVAPGRAEVWVTLRTMTDDGMDALQADAKRLAHSVAARDGVTVSFEEHDVFHHCENHGDAVALLRRAFEGEGIAHTSGVRERRSEDFGRFRTVAPSAMFFLGSGRGPDSPQLHNPDFDFPDELIDIGVRAFTRAVADFLG